MTDARGRIVVSTPVERIVTVRQGDQFVEVRQALPPALQVLTFGYQGPTGTLDANVLQRVLQTSEDAAVARQAAEQANAAAGTASERAEEAARVAGETSTDLDSLTGQLKNAFTYYAGAISANEG